MDKTHLGVLRVACLLDLVGPFLRESDGKNPQQIAISCFHINVCLDQSLEFRTTVLFTQELLAD